MYEEFFRLSGKPFRPGAKGPDVFVGPQTARLVQSMKSALVNHDAVVTVTGPAGIGKTTLAGRALDAYAGRMHVIRLPRARLAHDEVLNFLLDELDVADAPVGTLRRVLVCRQALTAKARAGTGVCVLVEDADRLGEDALIELEALTSADGSDDEGGRLVLLGGETFEKLLTTPDLGRLAQRSRLRFRVEALGTGELLAYLKHALRLVGGHYEEFFADDAVAVIAQASGGVPRLANRLIDAVLTTAAERQLDRIDGALVATVARARFDIECPAPATAPGATPAIPATKDSDDLQAAPVAGQSTPVPFAATASAPAPEDAVDAEDTAELEAPPAVLLEGVAADEPAGDPDTDADAETGSAADRNVDNDVPAVRYTPAHSGVSPPVALPAEPDRVPGPPLLAASDEQQHDTLPDLELLAPELARTALGDDDSAEIPTLFSSTRLEVTHAPGEDIAAVEHDAESTPAAPTEAPEPPAVAVKAAALPGVGAEGEARSAVPADVESASPLLPVAAPPRPAASETGIDAARAAAGPDCDPAATPAVAETGADTEVRAEPETGTRGETAAEGPPAAETPAWDKDPTLAELRPDLEALELAMAEFSQDERVKPAAADNDVPEVELKDPTFVGLPEITLDFAIQEKIAEATEALRKHDATIAEEEIDDAPVATGAAPDPAVDARIQEVAAGIAKARSLEDVDDRMAETLFGEEFSQIAAAVTAAGPNGAGNDDPDQTLELEQADDTPPASDKGSANTEPSALENEFFEVYGDDAIEVSLQSDERRGGLDLSASQRLATVRALNAERKSPEAARSAGAAGRPAPRRPVSMPSQTIEEQISTSMTQTLKTLSARPRPANDDDDDDDEHGKRGFFSRFRRH